MNHEQLMTHACSTNNLDLLEYIFFKGKDTHYSIIKGINCAIEHKHKETLEFLINKLYTYEDLSLESIKYIQNNTKYKFNHDHLFRHACKIGSLELVQQTFHKDLLLFDELLYGVRDAFKYKHYHIIQFFESSGLFTNDNKTVLNYCLYDACICGDIDLIEFTINKGADGLETGLLYACRSDNIISAKLMISKGATNFNEALLYSRSNTMRQLMIQYGASELNQALRSAIYNCNKEATKFLLNYGLTLKIDDIKSDQEFPHDFLQYLLIQVYNTVDIDTLLSQELFTLLSTLHPNINKTFLTEKQITQLLNHNITIDALQSRLFHKQRQMKQMKITTYNTNIKLNDTNIITTICNYIPFTELDIESFF